jgi:VanZ family protein
MKVSGGTLSVKRLPWQPSWHLGALAVYIGLIAYATLYPFDPRLPETEMLAAAWRMPRYYTQFDVAINALAYGPLGLLLYLYIRPQTGTTMWALLRAIAAGVALSAGLEGLQLFIAGRVPSIMDVASNTVGVAIGAMLVALPWGMRLVVLIHQARLRNLIEGRMGEVGLVLLAIWLLAQFNPAIPFFEAGNIAAATLPSDRPKPGGPAADAWSTLEATGAAASVIGFALFVSLLLRARAGRLRTVLLLIGVAALAKALTAAFMLKPALALGWFDRTNLAGVAMGVLLYAPLRRLPDRPRAYLAAMALLAGAMLTKAASIYDTLGDLIGIFRWPHGQLNNFTSLTRYLYEVWPLLALLFAVWLFIAPRRGRERSP